MTTAASPPAVRAATDGARRTRLRGVGLFTVVGWLVAAFLVTIATYPLLRVLLRLFWVDGSLDLSAIGDTLAVRGLASMIADTLVLVVASSTVALAIGALLAWVNERTDARMGIATDALPMMPFLLPPVAGAIGWVLLASPGAGYVNVVARDLLGAVGVEMTTGPFDIYSWYGLVGVMVVYQVPFVFLMVSAGLSSLDSALEEQSRICGAGTWRTLRKVTLPALAPSLGGAVLLMAWQGFAIFSIPAIIGEPAGIETLSVRIVRVLSFTFPPETGVAVGLSAIVVGFVGITWYLQTRLLRSGRFATVGGQSRDRDRIGLGAWRWPVRLLVIGYLIASVVLPIAALALVCLNGFWSPSIDWGSLSLDPVRETVFDTPSTFRALANSLRLGVTGATFGMVAAAIVAVVVTRSRTRFGRFADAAIKMPASISNIVLAVGILLAFAGDPFGLGGTFWILLIGYLALYLPQGSVAADTAASQVAPELAEASLVSGARAGRTFVKIQLPLMVPGLVAGWALLFARMAGDLTASAILSGTRNPVVGFRILDVYQNGSYAEVAALSTVLVAVTATVVTALMIWSRRHATWAGAAVGTGAT
ncbi:MAG: iron ABC transporter permease [Actinomycetota bacterium]|nr:iron ABC transporter permease [Actinomycetota bacterium]